MEAVASLISLGYFANRCNLHLLNYDYALFINLTNICSYLIILIPFIIQLHNRKTISSLRLEYVRFMALSSLSMPIFCLIISIVSVVSIYVVLERLLHRLSYDYLLVSYCLMGSSLSTVIRYLKMRTERVVVFSCQLYKYFLLILSSTVFGVIMNYKQTDILVIGVSWFIFIFRAKETLPRNILYYLLLCIEIIFLFLAFIIIIFQMDLSVKICSVLFSLLLLILGNLNEGKLLINTIQSYFDSSKNKNPQQLYYNLIKLRLNKHTQDNITCSICLENIRLSALDFITLECGHVFHLDCIFQWVSLSESCPFCRSSILLPEEDQLF